MRALLAAAVLLAAPGGAAADTWLDATDSALRADLEMLGDAGVLAAPLNSWPIPTSLITDALAGAGAAGVARPELELAVARVRATIERSQTMQVSAAAGRSALLRGFGAPLREDGELGLALTASGETVSGRLSLTAVADAADGQSLRADGSHLSLRAGNWLLSANTLDRFWGPARDSSLILSNNARPMAALMLERATAQPFESRWLSWLGPWRATALLGRMESERADVDRPLFLGLRASIRPRPWLELGAQRTAQFCGEGRPCSPSTFKDLLLGNDNRGIDATAESEPGNQLAGFDVRIVSPFRSVPVAIYSQLIGEDESSYWPVKLLGQYGIEAWHTLDRGARVQAFVEYSDAACSYNRATPRFGCAYTQGIFNAEGYRYRGRVIGHTADSDTESLVVGLSLREAGGDLWRLLARSARLNRGDVRNPYNSVSTVAADYQSIALGWEAERRWGRLRLQIGAERLEPQVGTRRSSTFGGVRLEWPD